MLLYESVIENLVILTMKMYRKATSTDDYERENKKGKGLKIELNDNIHIFQPTGNLATCKLKWHSKLHETDSDSKKELTKLRNNMDKSLKEKQLHQLKQMNQVREHFQVQQTR